MSTQHVTALIDEFKRDLIKRSNKRQLQYIHAVDSTDYPTAVIDNLFKVLLIYEAKRRKQTALEVIMKIIISCRTRCIMGSGV